MIKIESTSNNIFKHTKKLLGKNERKKSGCFILEGERLVRDAHKNGANIEYIIYSEDTSQIEGLSGIKAYVMPSKLFDGLKTTVNSQGILAVVKCPEQSFNPEDLDKGGCYLYLDSVMDPGNMGTILRTADAFGIKGVILSRGCVDVYNPKVIRSTMSGIFNVNLIFDTEDILNIFKAKSYRIIGTFLNTDKTPSKLDYSDKCVIVMGNEANGISAEIEKICDEKVKIPMTGGAESLNVSVACGIILYEAYKFRTNNL